MKEQFKKDLKERKDFLDKVENLRKLQNINNALSNMQHEDDTDEWIGKLNEESAFTEAKMEIAMESAKGVETELANEKEIETFVAEELIAQLKKEIALESGQPLPQDQPKSQSETPAEETTETTTDRPPRKMLDDLGLE